MLLPLCFNLCAAVLWIVLTRFAVSQTELQDIRFANSELQRKLESQTQRLELAIQQQAHASPHAFSPTAYAIQPPHRSAAPQPLQQLRPQPQPEVPQLQAGRHDTPAMQQLQLAQGLHLAHDTSGGHAPGKLQQWQSPPYHAGYLQSAPPTPQQAARKPPRSTPGE